MALAPVQARPAVARDVKTLYGHSRADDQQCGTSKVQLRIAFLNNVSVHFDVDWAVEDDGAVALPLALALALVGPCFGLLAIVGRLRGTLLGGFALALLSQQEVGSGANAQTRAGLLVGFLQPVHQVLEVAAAQLHLHRPLAVAQRHGADCLAQQRGHFCRMCEQPGGLPVSVAVASAIELRVHCERGDERCFARLAGVVAR